MSIKIDRYVIEDNFNAEDEIDGLEWKFDENNFVIVKWAWPRNAEVKLAFVFELAAEDCRNLEALIRNKESFVIITKNMDKCYNRAVSAGIDRIYKVFPGKFGLNGDIILINQVRNNVSGILCKKIKAYYKITYNKLMFSGYKKAFIEISCSDALDVESALYYSVAGKDMRYPLNGLSEDSILYVAQDKEITVNVFEAYENRVVLNRRKG